MMTYSSADVLVNVCVASIWLRECPSHFMSAAGHTFKMGLDANWIKVCETSPEAFPPVMLFADALSEMSNVSVCRANGGRPAADCSVTPLSTRRVRLLNPFSAERSI